MRRSRRLVVALALLAAACGDDSPTASDPSPTTTVVSSSTSSVPATTTPIAGEPVGEVVRVRLRGGIVRLPEGPVRVCERVSALGCHGGVVLAGVGLDDVAGEVQAESWGLRSLDTVVVEGDLDAAGIMHHAEISPDDRAASVDPPCDIEAGGYPTVGGPSFDEARMIINDYLASIGAQLGGPTSFNSTTGSHTIRVVGPVEAHQAAIDALLPGRVCVASVELSQWDLDEVFNTALALFDTWIERGYGLPSGGAQNGYNRVEVGLSAIDSRFWDDFGADAPFVRIDAFVEVVEGTVDDLPDAFPAPSPADTNRLGVACFGHPVDPSIFETAPDDHLDDHPSNAVFAATHLPGVVADESVGWWRAYEAPGEVVLVSDDERALLVVVSDGGWMWAGSGGCRLERFDPLGLAVNIWGLASGVTPDSTEVEIEFSENSCAGGQAPGERLLAPVVEETEESVTITVFIAPPIGDQTCQGNPVVNVSVPLAEPLSDRVLIDGARWPVEPVS